MGPTPQPGRDIVMKDAAMMLFRLSNEGAYENAESFGDL